MRLTTLFILSFIFFSGCKNQQNLVSPPSSGDQVKYSAIYLIHADANYLYHDENGNALRADEKVKAEAKNIGEQARQGEIFIFHQKPERKFLWLFSRKDRHMLHYRNGKLVNEGYYSPKNKRPLFSAEAEIYTQNRTETIADSAANIIMYFGHEIPSESGWVYHHSRKNVDVHTGTFSNGIESFLYDENIFDLTVLSTCNNGNPKMAHQLQPLTKTLLASPQNLHLSHIDTDAILQLEQGFVPGDSIAIQMAEKTFNRLSQNIHTEISLFVYDLETAGSYLPAIDSLYEEHLQEINPQPFEDNTDCTELPGFNEVDISAGVKGWYNPSQFGRRSNKKNHSGWGCRPASE